MLTIRSKRAYKFISIVLSTLMIIMSLSISVSAETDNTISERIKNIEETYDVVITYESGTEKYLDNNLTLIETALDTIGSSFTKKLSKAIYKHREVRFTMQIIHEPPKDAAYTTYGTGPNVIAIGGNLGVTIYAERLSNSSTIIHEIGHVFQTNNEKCIDDFYNLNGGYNSYPVTVDTRNPLDATRYVSHYGSTSVLEDFAETFLVMITKDQSHMNNINNLSSGSMLYKKYHYIQNALLEFSGPKSRATIRASEFLGISLENN